VVILLIALVVFGYPAALVSALRAGSAGPCGVATAAISIVVVGALFEATAWGGNRLVATYGYTTVAAGTLRLFALTLIMPIAAATVAVQITARRTGPVLGYVVGVITALAACVAATIVSARLGP
jgi:hypothetical protein